ncbi:MAG: hypothetical protein IAF94_18445 [Pirellulaceae bacterium]|nr:hypothetical protein [Pirellulaceae bacterium]
MINSSGWQAWAAASARGGLFLTLLLGGGSLATAKPPAISEVRTIVERHLRSNADYVPGDLISRKDVEPIFDELLSLGLPLSAGQEELYDDFVPDNSALARALRTPSGRKFMQKIKSIPSVYDRLERLSWNPQGRELIETLIEDPQGPAILGVMLLPTGKTAIAKYFHDDPSGKNFSLPTGRVHTAKELLQRLETVLAGMKKK